MVSVVKHMSTQVPIVRKDGTPTPYFARLLEDISDAKIAASVIDAMGGDPDANMVVVWDDAAGDLVFLSVSDMLDWIDDTHGAILYRDSAGWAALAPGDAGDVLTTQGSGADPTWETPSAGGGSGAHFNGIFFSTLAGTDTQNFASKGHTYNPNVNVTISAIWAVVDASAAAQAHNGQIATVNLGTGTIGTPVGTTSSVNSIGTGNRWMRFPFASPVSLTAGTEYIILVVNASGVGTTPVRISGATAGLMQAPGAYPITSTKQLRYNTINVTAGQTVSSSTNAVGYNIAVEGSVP